MSETTIVGTVKLGAKDLVNLALAVSPNRTICVQGEAGIGKSEIIGQIATKLRSDFYKSKENCAAMVKAWNELCEDTDRLESWSYEMGLPLVMRRLSQMTEGDLLGIPKNAPNGGTRFTMTDWVVFVCRFPSVLFLDERNRALEAIKQAIFEMQDSRKFHGLRFHSETRLMLAENVGDQYSVQALDPAEMSRALMVNFNPTVKDWLDWARQSNAKGLQNVHEYICEFISKNEQNHVYGEGFLEFRGMKDPGRKYPDRRAWKNLSDELSVYTDFINNPESAIFMHIAGGMVGPDVGGKFREFCKTLQKEVSAEDIIANWAKAKTKLGNDVTQNTWITLNTRIIGYIKNNVLTKEQAKQIGFYAKEISPELRLQLWSACSSSEKNLYILLPEIKDLMIHTATGQPAVAKTTETVAKPKPRQKV